jgi:hypothetical protein
MLVLYLLLVVVVWHQDRLVKGKAIDCTINEPMLFDIDEEQEKDSDSSKSSSPDEKKEDPDREFSARINTPKIEVLMKPEDDEEEHLKRKFSDNSKK